MEEIIQFLSGKCDRTLRVDENSLRFDFRPFFITFRFKPLLTSVRTDRVGHVASDTHDLREFQRRNILKVTISEVGFFRERERVRGSLNHEGLWPNNSPLFICFTLYSLLKEIRTFETLPDDDLYGFITTTKNLYSFKIDIPQNLWANIRFFQQIIVIFPRLPSSAYEVPEYCLSFLETDASIPDSKKIRMLIPNTKVKRLGYLKLLAEFMTDTKTISGSLINQKFEEYVAPYQEELKKGKISTGMITNRRGGSARPYIYMARNSGILNYLNGVYTAGKFFKVYIRLRREFIDNKHFILCTLDKFFWGEVLLKNDFFYLLNLLELIYIQKVTDYSKLKACFQAYILMKVEELIAQSGNWGDLFREEVNRLKLISKRIKNWQKPNKYLEHVLMPRLNWLFDLGFITLDKKLNASLTGEGLKLFKNICLWTDIRQERVINPDLFLDNFSIHMFDHIYQPEVANPNLEPEDTNLLNQKIIQYIDESFEYFRTLAPNRVTVSQAVNYTKYKLYFADGFICEYNDILEFLKKSAPKIFILKVHQKHQDGYIQKRRS